MNLRKKKRIAIFASGAGSNAKKIIEYFRNHAESEIALVVCNKPDAGVLQVAKENHIPFVLINKKEFEETGYAQVLSDAGISLLVLAGFLWKVPGTLIHLFPGRIINIHPALLPGYGGKSMYGKAVHTAVVNAKEKESGITIHFVNEEYDKGQIIFQEKIYLNEDETPESLADRIHQLEHTHFPRVIEEVLNRLSS